MFASELLKELTALPYHLLVLTYFVVTGAAIERLLCYLLIN